MEFSEESYARSKIYSNSDVLVITPKYKILDYSRLSPLVNYPNIMVDEDGNIGLMKIYPWTHVPMPIIDPDTKTPIIISAMVLYIDNDEVGVDCSTIYNSNICKFSYDTFTNLVSKDSIKDAEVSVNKESFAVQNDHIYRVGDIVDLGSNDLYCGPNYTGKIVSFYSTEGSLGGEQINIRLDCSSNGGSNLCNIDEYAISANYSFKLHENE